jgi:two-component system NtrC family sensor kinase
MDTPRAEHMSGDGRVDDRLLNHLANNEKMAELGRLSAGIIHEINTPLSVIAAASQMILCERNLSESVVEMVERIHLEVQRLSRLTKGILSFSREDDSMEGETDLNLALGEVLAFLKYEIQKSSTTVVERLDPYLPIISANQNVLKQIFLNLLVNALQAMGTGGCIHLETFLSDDDSIRVIVRDNGPGIPKDVIGKIFTPFFTTKEPGRGTGLGLFVTRRNVDRLGGRIEVESEEGEGACFTLIFPRVEEETHG